MMNYLTLITAGYSVLGRSLIHISHHKINRPMTRNRAMMRMKRSNYLKRMMTMRIMGQLNYRIQKTRRMIREEGYV